MPVKQHTMQYFRLVLLIALGLNACGNPQKNQDQNNNQDSSASSAAKADQSQANVKDTGSATTANPSPNKFQNPFPEDLLLDSAAISQPPAPNYKRLQGYGMPFTVKIPETWQIRNKPPAGDGYTFQVGEGEGEADARVYHEATKDQPTGIAPPECDKRTPFEFREQKGIKCQKAEAVYYYLENNKKRLVFYVKATSEWRKRHAKQLDQIARSLAFKSGQQVS